MLKFLDKLDTLLNKILMVLGGVALLSLMTLATGNVVFRIFHIPFRGTYEVVAFLGAVVTAFALGRTQQKKNHIVVDILTQRFPKKLNRVLDAINYFVTMILFSIISWQTFLWGLKIRESGELSETLKVVFHPFIFSVALGFAVLAFTLFVDLLKAFQKKKEEHA